MCGIQLLNQIIYLYDEQKRGMQSTMFVEMAPGVTVSDLYQHLKSTYEVCLFDHVD